MRITLAADRRVSPFAQGIAPALMRQPRHKIERFSPRETNLKQRASSKVETNLSVPVPGAEREAGVPTPRYRAEFSENSARARYIRLTRVRR
jgi:hypothetical protein